MADGQTTTAPEKNTAKAAERPLTSETIELLHQRVSVRKFSDEPVSEEIVEALLRAAFRAPTSSNIQSYSVIAVRDRETLKKLSVVTGNQVHVAKTPVFLAFCADLTRIQYAMEKNDQTIEDNNLEVGLVASIDASLVGMSAYLTAESLGLRGLMIGAVRNNAVKTAEILGLPHRVYCVFGMCLGWPGEAPKQKPRMAHQTVIHYEQHGGLKGGRDMPGWVDTYDADLAAHYNAVGKETTPDSWSHDVNKKFKVQPREKLRQELKQLGFDFR
jgi:nitroreductase